MCSCVYTRTLAALLIIMAPVRARQLCSRMRVQLLSFERGRARTRQNFFLGAFVYCSSAAAAASRAHDTGAHSVYNIYNQLFLPGAARHHGAPTETYHYRTAYATPQIAHECVRLFAHIGHMLTVCMLFRCCKHEQNSVST